MVIVFVFLEDTVFLYIVVQELCRLFCYVCLYQWYWFLNTKYILRVNHTSIHSASHIMCVIDHLYNLSEIKCIINNVFVIYTRFYILLCVHVIDHLFWSFTLCTWGHHMNSGFMNRIVLSVFNISQAIYTSKRSFVQPSLHTYCNMNLT